MPEKGNNSRSFIDSIEYLFGAGLLYRIGTCLVKGCDPSSKQVPLNLSRHALQIILDRYLLSTASAATEVNDILHPGSLFNRLAIADCCFQVFYLIQIDVDFLNHVVDDIGEVDIIVDDGSHLNDHVVKSFETLFPKLKNGGIYVIEDTQTSYWESYGGDSINLHNTKTMMNYFKKFIDGLNYKEFVNPAYQASYFDLHITSIHFYHNLIFIYKGDNVEESNVLIDNTWPDLL